MSYKSALGPPLSCVPRNLHQFIFVTATLQSCSTLVSIIRRFLLPITLLRILREGLVFLPFALETPGRPSPSPGCHRTSQATGKCSGKVQGAWGGGGHRPALRQVVPDPHEGKCPHALNAVPRWWLPSSPYWRHRMKLDLLWYVVINLHHFLGNKCFHTILRGLSTEMRIGVNDYNGNTFVSVISLIWFNAQNGIFLIS